MTHDPDLSRREKSPVRRASISAISQNHFSAFANAFLIASFGNSGKDSSLIIYTIINSDLQIDGDCHVGNQHN